MSANLKSNKEDGPSSHCTFFSSYALFVGMAHLTGSEGESYSMTDHIFMCKNYL